MGFYGRSSGRSPRQHMGRGEMRRQHVRGFGSGPDSGIRFVLQLRFHNSRGKVRADIAMSYDTGPNGYPELRQNGKERTSIAGVVTIAGDKGTNAVLLDGQLQFTSSAGVTAHHPGGVSGNPQSTRSYRPWSARCSSTPLRPCRGAARSRSERSCSACCSWTRSAGANRRAPGKG